MLNKSNILKLSLFATGLSGIVAEYILSTLATYFLGNSVIQWTLILSVMLFSMGLGSRISKFMDEKLLEKFIIIEFSLSLLVSFCSVLAYLAAAYSSFNDEVIFHALRYEAAVIYVLSILIGMMIGMEIPLVTRLNDEFETLKVNISNVMEKDYYGSLIGGLFFAFVGLPILGLTYTPFVLGSVNFLVALLLFYKLKDLIAPKYQLPLRLAALLITFLLIVGTIMAKNIIEFGEQKRYKDHVVFQEQTAYQQIVITQWKNDYWLYLNSNHQLSTLDEWLYHEPLVHPVMQLTHYPQDILILGGGDGCAAREVLKYPSVKSITLVDIDPRMTEIAATNPIFTKMNQGALSHNKMTIHNTDAFNFMVATQNYYDVIIIDFPDPKSIELGRLFSQEFFNLCYRQLRPQGVLITQSGSPYYASKAFYCIEKTIRSAGFSTVPIHNQVLTLGEWGWVIGAKHIKQQELLPRLRSLHFDKIPTRWLTDEAMLLITSFGKNLVILDSAKVEINTIHNPVLPTYYREGNWDLY